MKNYPKRLVSDIQDVIDSKRYTSRAFESFDDMPHAIYANGVLTKLETRGGHNVADAYNDYTFMKRDMAEWSKEPIRMLYVRDWKGDDCDEASAMYSELTFMMGNRSVTALVRNIEGCGFGESTVEYMSDVTIGGDRHAIIKMFFTDGESYTAKSKMESVNFVEHLIFNYKFYGEDEDECAGADDFADCAGDAESVADEAMSVADECMADALF